MRALGPLPGNGCLGPIDPKQKPPIPRSLLTSFQNAPRGLSSRTRRNLHQGALVKKMCNSKFGLGGILGNAPYRRRVIPAAADQHPATGFTAMQRLTGWHASIVAAMMARGEIPVGSRPLEVAVPGASFVREARKRGFNINVRIRPIHPDEEDQVYVGGAALRLSTSLA